VEFEDGWLIKSSFITMDEIKACQLTRTEFPPKNKNCGKWLNRSFKEGFKMFYLEI
jgi:hypothetical protein